MNPLRVMYSFILGGIYCARMEDAGDGLLRATRRPEDVTEDALHAVAEMLYREVDLGKGDGTRTIRTRDGAPVVLSVRGAEE